VLVLSAMLSERKVRSSAQRWAKVDLAENQTGLNKWRLGNRGGCEKLWLGIEAGKEGQVKAGEKAKVGET
jgi:hypothetical protein